MPITQFPFSLRSQKGADTDSSRKSLNHAYHRKSSIQSRSRWNVWWLITQASKNFTQETFFYQTNQLRIWGIQNFWWRVSLLWIINQNAGLSGKISTEFATFWNEHSKVDFFQERPATELNNPFVSLQIYFKTLKIDILDLWRHYPVSLGKYRTIA